MKRKFVVMLMAVVMLVGVLAGCGGSDAAETGSSVETPGKETSEESGESEAPKKNAAKGSAELTLLTKVVNYNPDGSVESVTDEHEYVVEGNIVKEIGYNEDGSSYVKQECEYDSAGNIVRKIAYGEDDSISTYECEYDSTGTIIKVIEYCEDGTSDEHEFDSIGNQTKEIRYNEDGSIASEGGDRSFLTRGRSLISHEWDEYEYDSAGNKIKGMDYDESGDVSFWCEYDSARNISKAMYRDSEVYEYDNTGNVVKITLSLGSRKIETEHDSAGRVIKSTQYYYNNDNGRIEYWTEFEYNGENSNTYKTISYNEDGSLRSEEEVRNTTFGIFGFPTIIKRISYESGGITLTWSDHFGNTAQAKVLGLHAGLTEKDESGNTTKITGYNSEDGSFQGYMELEYNDTGYITKIMAYNRDGDITLWTEYEYMTVALE